MKYYRRENNEFTGFYDSSINKEIFEEGGRAKEGFHKLSEEKWQALLDGQSQGKEIKILKDGTLGLYEKPTYTGGEFVKPTFDEESETWKEGATKEEVLIERKNKLLEYKRLKNEVTDLEELAELDEEFASPETIEMLKAKMDTLKAEIRELTKIAKNL